MDTTIVVSTIASSYRDALRLCIQCVVSVFGAIVFFLSGSSHLSIVFMALVVIAQRLQNTCLAYWEYSHCFVWKVRCPKQLITAHLYYTRLLLGDLIVKILIPFQPFHACRPGAFPVHHEPFLLGHSCRHHRL